MDKWADYLISEVSYDVKHLLSAAIRHQDTSEGITKGKPVDRLTILSDIKNGLSYITIYSGKNSWKKGHLIHTFSINSEPFLRIDRNKVELDFLGDLPGVSSIKLDELDLAPEPVTEEPTPEPEKQKPTPSPRGSLPKESAEELPQELDLAPEPVTEEPTPEPEEEEATPEQLARLEQLEKQIQELESRPEPTPEPEEEEATPEQLAQLNELQKQIDELESKLSTYPVPRTESEPNTEPIIEEYSEFNELEVQIDELENELFSKLHPSYDEPTDEQVSKINELEKQIQELESSNIEQKIIQTLQKQNKKLDEIQKKLEQPSDETSESLPLEAYCVKCKTKRKIKNAEETIMKNGRAATKGICPICNCKVFLIGKMKK